MNFKPISGEAVAELYKSNIHQHQKSVHEAALVSLLRGPVPVTPDPAKPFAVQLRHVVEGVLPEDGWCTHTWRFPNLVSASRAANDIVTMDSRLQVRIVKCAGAIPFLPPMENPS